MAKNIEESIRCYCTISFDYDLNDYVTDWVHVNSNEDYKRFEGKKFRDLSTEELEEITRIDFFNLIDSGNSIEVTVEIGD